MVFPFLVIVGLRADWRPSDCEGWLNIYVYPGHLRPSVARDCDRQYKPTPLPIIVGSLNDLLKGDVVLFQTCSIIVKWFIDVFLNLGVVSKFWVANNFCWVVIKLIKFIIFYFLITCKRTHFLNIIFLANNINVLHFYLLNI